MRRKEIVEKYDDAFVMMPEIRIQREILESNTTRHLYVIRVVPENLKCTRREFFDALAAENVCPQVHYLPVYWHPYYESLGYEKGLCPNAESFYEEAMSIPLYFSMSDQDVEDVITAVKKVVEYYKK
jgi:dTDP-4-amino-4,6-dideoxygalactose transaminase